MRMFHIFRAASIEETAHDVARGMERIEHAIEQIMSNNGQDAHGVEAGIEKLWARKESEFWQGSNTKAVDGRYLSFRLLSLLEKSGMMRVMLEYGGDYVPSQFTPFGQAVLMHMHQKHIVEPGKSQTLVTSPHFRGFAPTAES